MKLALIKLKLVTIMNHSNKELELFWHKSVVFLCRTVLLLLIIGITYVVSRPAYNFAHWIPHNLIRQIGVSYEHMLWAEQRADIALHFIGGLLLTLLLVGSQLPFLHLKTLRVFTLVCVFCIAAEIMQHLIGRGFDYLDLLLGILGSFMAYLGIIKNKLARI